MSPLQERVHAILYDRLRFGIRWITFHDLADETRIKKSTLNTTLYRMNKKGIINIFRNKGKGITINGVQ